MSGAIKWIIVALIGIYVLSRTLTTLAMTAIRISGEVVATAPAEQAAYFLSMPWAVIAFAWAALFISVGAMALLAFGRPGATRALSVAIIIDIGSWFWERSLPTYADAHSAADQSLHGLMILVMISIVALMMLARRRGTLT